MPDDLSNWGNSAVNEKPVTPVQMTVAVRDDALAAEMAAVERELQAALVDLNPPFRQLAQRQLRESYPLLRAGVVLATAVSEPDSERLQTRRIDLAAALEMLYLALGIHTGLLGGQGNDQAPERSLLGSAILAGDYCFSRAAALAVRTDSATVVEIFARALRRVSEGHLRGLLDAVSADYDEQEELFASGVAAAGELAALTPAQLAANQVQGSALARTVRDPLARDRGTATNAMPTGELSPRQRRRWASLAALADHLY